MLAASGAQTVDVSSEAALKASDILGKVANLDAASKDKFLEAFKQVAQPDSRAAALDIALFHLCMLDQNGTFSHENMAADRKGQKVLDAYRDTVHEALKPLIGQAATPAPSPASAAK